MVAERVPVVEKSAETSSRPRYTTVCIQNLGDHDADDTTLTLFQIRIDPRDDVTSW